MEPTYTDESCTTTPARMEPRLSTDQSGLRSGSTGADCLTNWASIAAAPGRGRRPLAAASALGIYLLRRNREAPAAVAAAGGTVPDAAGVSPEEMEKLKRALSEVAD